MNIYSSKSQIKVIKEKKIIADSQEFTPITVTPACITDSIV
jgi:hypothetical protein